MFVQKTFFVAFFIFCLACAGPNLCSAQTNDTTIIQQAADTIVAQMQAPIVQIPVTAKNLIIPGALVAYGAITLSNGGLRKINMEARERFWDGRSHKSPYLEDYTLLIPAATVYTLNIFGVKGQNNFVDRSILYGMSNA